LTGRYKNLAEKRSAKETEQSFLCFLDMPDFQSAEADWHIWLPDGISFFVPNELKILSVLSIQRTLTVRLFFVNLQCHLYKPKQE
jgi:hypothetical protein